MGQLFNRSQMHKLEGLMLRHINAFIQLGTAFRHELNLTPACRALEADIICMLVCVFYDGHYLPLLLADFSFGHTIGALEAFSRGSELQMVAKNDEKATWMPVVRMVPLLNNGQPT